MTSADLSEPPIIEVPVGLPPNGATVWYYPGAVREGGHADVVARITRRDGTSWIACLPQTHALINEAMEIFAMPCGERVYIAGGIADRDEPKSWQPLRVAKPHRVSWSTGRDFVVFNDYAAVEAHGRVGPLWYAVLGSDIGINSVTDDRVVVSIYDWSTNEDVHKSFDLISGRALDIDNSGLN